jgi:methyl-accepting chemotaxis protein
VNAIEGITGTIEKINGIQTVIAGSVSKQGTATKEILRNVSDASQGTSDVSVSIQAVAKTVQSTSISAGEMAGLTNSLREETERLRSEVGNFLQHIRNGEGGSVKVSPPASDEVRSLPIRGLRSSSSARRSA